MSMHAPALMPGRHVRQPVRRLKAITPPAMQLPLSIQGGTLGRTGPQMKTLHGGQRQALGHPVQEMLIRGLVHQRIEILVIERANHRLQVLLQGMGFRARNAAPTRLQGRAQFHPKAMAMETATARFHPWAGQAPRRFKTGCGPMRELRLHGVIP